MIKTKYLFNFLMVLIITISITGCLFDDTDDSTPVELTFNLSSSHALQHDEILLTVSLNHNCGVEITVDDQLVDSENDTKSLSVTLPTTVAGTHSGRISAIKGDSVLAEETFSYVVNKIEVKYSTFTVNGVSFNMVHVDGGSFMMGAQNTDSKAANYDPSAADNESPIHKVTLSSFYIGQTEVTQALWKAVMGTDDFFAYTPGDDHPMDYLYRKQVSRFIKKLNQLTGENFRLPTEAEWEFAARGGNRSKGYIYSGSNNLDEVAWNKDNSDTKSHPVATKSPNELGIYDMSGNLLEFCQDWYSEYSHDDAIDPQGPAEGALCVVRGGSWCLNDKVDCRVSCRDKNSISCSTGYNGFRLAL